MNDAPVPLNQAAVPDQWGDQARWPKTPLSSDANAEGDDDSAVSLNAWAYSASTVSTWVRVGDAQPTSLHGDMDDLAEDVPIVTVTLVYPRTDAVRSAAAASQTGVSVPSSLIGHSILTSGLPRMIARAQETKRVMNRVAFDVSAGGGSSACILFCVAFDVSAGGGSGACIFICIAFDVNGNSACTWYVYIDAGHEPCVAFDVICDGATARVC